MPKMGYHEVSVEELMERLGTGMEGLSDEEAKRRLGIYGYNEIVREKKAHWIKLLLSQFKSFLIMILIFATLLSLTLGEVLDAVVILVILLASGLIGFYQEFRSEKAVELLKKLAEPTASVIRSGRELRVPTREIVLGDIVVLRAGDRIPADLRLLEAVNLRVNESILTGESMPVEKRTHTLGEVPLAERENMAYSGTIAVYGRGLGIVVATGMNTELGKVAKAVQEVEEKKSPLESRMERLGRMLAYLAVLMICVMSLLGVMKGYGFLEMLLWSVSLAVAAVPESLPAVVAGSLALGAYKMAKRNAIVRRLPAAETLGTVTVICSDKTGTMTKGEVTVRKLYVNGELVDVEGVGYEPKGEVKCKGKTLEFAKLLARIGCTCNDAKLVHGDGWSVIGDGTEGSLLVLAKKLGVGRVGRRVGEIPFSPERKRMTTIDEVDGKLFAHTKGAPETILPICDYILIDRGPRRMDKELRAEVMRVAEEMASHGLRVFSFSYKELGDGDAESGMVFVGLAGMIDPPREEAIEAVRLCKQAGVSVKMVTGDHELTAKAVARELGLFDKRQDLSLKGRELDRMGLKELKAKVKRVAVFARTTPMHKLMILKALKDRGHVVAMTGDGVNDAPALKSADIGVAMGLSGTEVAKESADMILADDNFATIVEAVKEGRNLFENMKKFLLYMISCNLGEIILMFLALILSLPLPLLPKQILWLNLATDGIPAIALGIGSSEEGLMKEPPRNPRAGVFQGVKGRLVGISILFVLACIAPFIYGIGIGNVEEARTATFATSIMFELFVALSASSLEELVLKRFSSNKFLLASLAWEFFMLMLIIYDPFFNFVFSTVPLSPIDLIVVLPLSLTGFAFLELVKLIGRTPFLPSSR